MMAGPSREEQLYLSRSDPWNPLASYSRHDFELDGAVWPSVEHYYQAMKFEQPELRERIRAAPHPRDAAAIARKFRRSQRRDWKAVRRVVMTRAVYLTCRTHPEAARQLLETGQRRLVESSQYDYYWGCGRDGRGFNTFGEVLMDVRDKLRKTAVTG